MKAPTQPARPPLQNAEAVVCDAVFAAAGLRSSAPLPLVFKYIKLRAESFQNHDGTVTCLLLDDPDWTRTARRILFTAPSIAVVPVHATPLPASAPPAPTIAFEFAIAQAAWQVFRPHIAYPIAQCPDNTPGAHPRSAAASANMTPGVSANMCTTDTPPQRLLAKQEPRALSAAVLAHPPSPRARLNLTPSPAGVKPVAKTQNAHKRVNPSLVPKLDAEIIPASASLPEETLLAPTPVRRFAAFAGVIAAADRAVASPAVAKPQEAAAQRKELLPTKLLPSPEGSNTGQAETAPGPSLGPHASTTEVRKALNQPAQATIQKKKKAARPGAASRSGASAAANAAPQKPLTKSCEDCGKLHDGSHGSGRFCDSECSKRQGARVRWRLEDAKRRARQQLTPAGDDGAVDAARDSSSGSNTAAVRSGSGRTDVQSTAVPKDDAPVRTTTAADEAAAALAMTELFSLHGRAPTPKPVPKADASATTALRDASPPRKKRRVRPDAPIPTPAPPKKMSSKAVPKRPGRKDAKIELGLVGEHVEVCLRAGAESVHGAVDTHRHGHHAALMSASGAHAATMTTTTTTTMTTTMTTTTDVSTSHGAPSPAREDADAALQTPARKQCFESSITPGAERPPLRAWTPLTLVAYRADTDAHRGVADDGTETWVRLRDVHVRFM